MSDQTNSVTSQLQQLTSLLGSLNNMAESPQVRADKANLMRLIEEIRLNCQIELAFEGASEKQTEFSKVFFAREYNGLEIDILGMVGGNRSGKTYCAGYMCVGLYLKDYAKDGEVFWCVAPTNDKSISGQQKELWQALPRKMFGKQVYDSKSGFGKISPVIELILPGGRGKCLVRFKAASQWESNPATFEQEKVAGAWIDETVKEGVFNAIQPRLTDLNGWLLVTTIPDEPWMFVRLEEAANDPAMGVFYTKMCMMDNEHHLPEGAIAKYLKRWSKDECEMRIFGNFRFLKGIVFKEFIKQMRPDGHLFVPGSIDFSSKVDGKIEPWPKWRFLDYGNSHPTWCGWGTVGPDGNKYIYREYHNTNSTVQTVAEDIITGSRGEYFHSPMVIDCNAYNHVMGNPWTIADQFQQAGVQCISSIKTGKRYPEWSQVQQIKKLLEDNKLFISADCKMLILNLSMWMYKYDKSGKPMGSEAFDDKNNDGIDAVRYWIATDPRFQTSGGSYTVFSE